MRNGASCAFDVSKIVDAVSKACIRRETKKVEKKIHEVELFSGVGGFNELLDIEEIDDIVNIGLHFFLKNVRPYAAFCCEA